MLRFHSINVPLTEGGLPVVFTVCFCLFFTYIISNFLMTIHFCEFMLHKILLIFMLCFGWVQSVSTLYGINKQINEDVITAEKIMIFFSL